MGTSVYILYNTSIPLRVQVNDFSHGTGAVGTSLLECNKIIGVVAFNMQKALLAGHRK
jgi:hypothetical protein